MHLLHNTYANLKNALRTISSLYAIWAEVYIQFFIYLGVKYLFVENVTFSVELLVA